MIRFGLVFFSRLLFPAALLSLTVGPSVARVTKVEVQCDAEQVFVGDTFGFRVVVSTDGESPPRPQIPAIENLIVRAQANITLRSNIKGRISQTFSYIARAQKPGTVTLAGIRAGGVVAPPVRVQVLDRSQAPPKPVQRPPVFVEAKVDRTEVWQGEQIVFEYFLYFREGSPRRGGLRAPSLDDALNAFITKEVDIRPTGRETIVDGMKYTRALLVRRVLFPLEPGDYEIPPIRLVGDWQIQDRRSRRDFFSFFGETTVPLDHLAGGPVQSDPLKIKVSPLPTEGRPPNFLGSVGQFSFSARQDKQTVAVGEPFTLSLTISGDGNMDSVAEPKLNFPDWLETYDSEREAESWFDSKTHRLQGRIKYDFVLIPRKEGKFILDPVEFSYFDPGNSRYVTLKQGPFHLEVTPETWRGVTYLQGKRRRIRVTGTDFRHIRPPAVINLGQDGPPATRTAGFWLSLFGPWMIYAGLFLYRKRQDFLQRNPDIAEKIRVRTEVRKRLAVAAGAIGSDDNLFYRELENAIHDHLSAHIGVSTRGLTRPQLHDLLVGRDSRGRSRKKRGRISLSEETANRILNLLEELDHLRYAPASLDRGHRADLLEEVKQLLNQVKAR